MESTLALFRCFPCQLVANFVLHGNIKIDGVEPNLRAVKPKRYKYKMKGSVDNKGCRVGLKYSDWCVTTNLFFFIDPLLIFRSFCPVASAHGAEQICVAGASAQAGDRSGRRLRVSGVWMGLPQPGWRPGPLHTKDGRSAHCVDCEV